LSQESKAILDASESGNLQNAFATTAKNASQNAAAQFGEVYTGITNNAEKIIPLSAAVENFIVAAGSKGTMLFMMVNPRYFKHPNSPFYKTMD
jgi:hypothetical protein